MPSVRQESLVFEHISKDLDTSAIPLRTAIEMIAYDPVQDQPYFVIFCAIMFYVSSEINSSQGHII